MAWQEFTKMEMKLEFISLVQRGCNISELCRRFNISRKTGYKWLNRYKVEGRSGLEEISRKPHNSPLATKDKVIKTVLKTRLDNPFWGGRKIKAYLEKGGKEDIPSPSAISNILKRNGLINPYPNERTSSFRRFEHEAPNRLWQMDFKGHFAMEDKRRCHPLDILDDHSRYLLCLEACLGEDRVTVKEILESVFKHYGMPDRINVDNGSPWGNSRANTRFTDLSLWLVKHGIKVSYSRPHHPQTNGKIERLHRTLKQEVITNQYYKDLLDVQSSFDRWRHTYNHERPHEALDMQPPITRYEPSYRSYKEKIEEYEYDKEYKLYKVDKKGRIFINRKEIYTSSPLAGEVLGVIPTEEDGIFNLFFRHQMIMKVDLRK